MSLEQSVKLNIECLNRFTTSFQRTTEAWKHFCELLYAYSTCGGRVAVYPNNRVKHLAKHAKKHRTRKKNQHRALYIQKKKKGKETNDQN